MILPGTAAHQRRLALLALAAFVLPLAAAFASAAFLRLVPCAFCLVERKPYYVGAAIALLALFLPPRLTRVALWAIIGIFLAAALLHFVHSGVEWHWWPDPIPECATRDFRGMTMAQRLAAMPARPAKPCDFADYPIPFIPMSLANYGMIYALAAAAFLGFSLYPRKRLPQ